jgi:hypothetical protein
VRAGQETLKAIEGHIIAGDLNIRGGCAGQVHRKSGSRYEQPACQTGDARVPIVCVGGLHHYRQRSGIPAGDSVLVLRISHTVLRAKESSITVACTVPPAYLTAIAVPHPLPWSVQLVTHHSRVDEP